MNGLERACLVKRLRLVGLACAARVGFTHCACRKVKSLCRAACCGNVVCRASAESAHEWGLRSALVQCALAEVKQNHTPTQRCR